MCLWFVCLVQRMCHEKTAWLYNLRDNKIAIFGNETQTHGRTDRDRQTDRQRNAMTSGRTKNAGRSGGIICVCLCCPCICLVNRCTTGGQGGTQDQGKAKEEPIAKEDQRNGRNENKMKTERHTPTHATH